MELGSDLGSALVELSSRAVVCFAVEVQLANDSSGDSRECDVVFDRLQASIYFRVVERPRVVSVPRFKERSGEKSAGFECLDDFSLIFFRQEPPRMRLNPSGSEFLPGEIVVVVEIVDDGYRVRNVNFRHVVVCHVVEVRDQAPQRVGVSHDKHYSFFGFEESGFDDLFVAFECAIAAVCERLGARS